MIKKIDILRDLMRTEQWHKAIKFAAKFPRLEPHKDRILAASSALLSPNFYISIGKNPELIIQDGIAALKEKYS